MNRINPARVTGFLAALCAFCLLIAALTPAVAQRNPSQGGSRGGGNAGGLILRFAPAIIEGLRNNSEQPDKTKPRRKKANTAVDDDPGPKVKKQRQISRPPVQQAGPLPPGRLLPPSFSASTIPPFPQSVSAMLAERPQFKPGEIVVMVRGEEPDVVAVQVAQSYNLILLETMSLTLLGTSRVYRFSVPDGRPVETIVAAVTNVPGVGFASTDSYYWLQGGIGKQADLQYALPKMHVAAAQAMVSGRGMTVAVIDSGVDASHPSLKNANLTLYDAVNGGVLGPDMHGTAITGIIAASGDIRGVAPGAKILAMRAFAAERPGAPPVTSATTLARAVDVAFSQGARIFNMSFAGRRDPLLIEMIDAAYARGAVFVAAAGNEGPDAPPAYPAAHDKVIAITATDQADALYGQANRGGYVLAAAPGVDILAPVMGKGFDYLSGTSFAAAHVTGIIALLMERNPQLTTEMIRRVLVKAARDLGAKGQDHDFGAGLTDAYGALLLVGKN